MIGWVVLTSTRTSSATRFLEVSQSWLLHASIWAFATPTAAVSVFIARCLLVAASPGFDAEYQLRHRRRPKLGGAVQIHPSRSSNRCGRRREAERDEVSYFSMETSAPAPARLPQEPAPWMHRRIYNCRSEAPFMAFLACAGNALVVHGVHLHH